MRSIDRGPTSWGVSRVVKMTLYRVNNIDNCEGCQYKELLTQDTDGSWWCKASLVWREKNCKDIK